MEELKKLLESYFSTYKEYKDILDILRISFDMEADVVHLLCVGKKSREYDNEWECIKRSDFNKLKEIVEKNKDKFIESKDIMWSVEEHKYIYRKDTYILKDTIKDKSVSLQLNAGTAEYYVSYKGCAVYLIKEALPELFETVKHVNIASSLLNSDIRISEKIATREKIIKDAKEEIKELKRQQESINTVKEFIKEKLGEEEYSRQLLIHEIKKF